MEVWLIEELQNISVIGWLCVLCICLIMVPALSITASIGLKQSTPMNIAFWALFIIIAILQIFK